MATKKNTKNKKPIGAKSEPKAIPATAPSSADGTASRAHAIVMPTAQAAMTLHDIARMSSITTLDLYHEMEVQVKAVHGGDLTQAETMLVTQAHTLDAIFNSLTRCALGSKMINQYEIKFRLALRAQAQCRATLETLVAIKNPPVIFARQANIANGPQQVNNSPIAAASRAEESKSQPNKLLEHQHGERLDFGTTSKASGADSKLETVGAVHRPKDARRQGKGAA
jgi:hypothetical protein